MKFKVHTDKTYILYHLITKTLFPFIEAVYMVIITYIYFIFKKST